MILSRRTLVAASIAVSVVTIALVVPASVAYAQDDLICARSDTRQTTTKNPEGDYVTTVIGYCAEWIWRPPAPTKDHEPRPTDGGKGGDVPDHEKLDCDAVKRLLADRIWEREELIREIPLMEQNIAETEKREAEDREEKNDRLAMYVSSQQNVDILLTYYVSVNDLETEVVYSPKPGVEIIKSRSNYTVNPNLPGGPELIIAIEEQERYRGFSEAAHDRWEATVDSLESGREGLARMRDQLAALGPIIEELQRMLHDCK